MAEESFNLIDEPWLLVRETDGQRNLVSVREAFADAHRLVGLGGDLPTQEVALLRLLIAILYRALPLPVSLNERIDAWQDWWEASTLPIPRIEAYLDKHRQRFDLLDPVAPFMQVADLSANKTSGLSKLIADVPPNEQFFTTRAARGLESIDLAEAARWLVHVQTYDPSGIKSGAHGDPRVKGGKGYPIGIGWSGWCGMLLPQGRNLKETLLLGLALNLDSAGARWSVDLPVWERPPLTAVPETGHEEPRGTADLLTWQARRVRLIVEHGRVTDALITNGDPIHARNRQGLEPHSGWRHSPTQGKIHGGDVYMPRTHDPDRAIWRGLPGLLPQSRIESGRVGSEAPKALPAAVLDWLAALVDAEALDPAYPVYLRAVGVTYGSQSSTVSSVSEDRVELRAAVFADEQLRGLIRDMIGSTESAVVALRGLAANLAVAAGIHETEGHRNAASLVAYDEIEPRFLRWLGGVKAGANTDDLARSWHDQVLHLLIGLGDDLARAAGRPAWLGRAVAGPGSTGSRHLDSSLATIWFRAALRKALPAATPPTGRGHQSDVPEGEEKS